MPMRNSTACCHPHPKDILHVPLDRKHFLTVPAVSNKNHMLSFKEFVQSAPTDNMRHITTVTALYNVNLDYLLETICSVDINNSQQR